MTMQTPPPSHAEAETTGVTHQLAEYAAGVDYKNLPEAVIQRAKEVTLDTFGAMISGSRLVPGERLVPLLQRLPVGTATVAVADHPVAPQEAALLNGILAHADETDDSHFTSKTHPASTCVPAALALAEDRGVGGRDFIAAVVAGYDVQCRASIALGPVRLQAASFIPLSLCGNFGATAAASRVLRLNTAGMVDALGLVGCMTGGIWACNREPDHTAKALMAGAPARNGTLAATLAEAEFHGPPAIFEGPNGIFIAYGGADAPLLVEELGVRYEILGTSIKKHACGGPIRGPVDGLLVLMSEHQVEHTDIESIAIYIAPSAAVIVDDRVIPSISLQYVIAVAAVDGHVGVTQTHDPSRTNDPVVLDLKSRVELVRHQEFEPAYPGQRPSITEIRLKDGRVLSRRIDDAEGSPTNPLRFEQIEEKFHRLVEPVIGVSRGIEIAQRVKEMDDAASMATIARLLANTRASRRA